MSRTNTAFFILYAIEQLSHKEEEVENLKQKNVRAESELQTLLATFNELKQRNDQTEKIVKSLQIKLDSSSQTEEATTAKANQINEELMKAQSLIKKLKGDLEVAANTIKVLEQERSNEKEFLLTFNAREKALRCKLAIMDDIRRKLHNKVMALSGNIRGKFIFEAVHVFKSRIYKYSNIPPFFSHLSSFCSSPPSH